MLSFSLALSLAYSPSRPLLGFLSSVSSRTLPLALKTALPFPLGRCSSWQLPQLPAHSYHSTYHSRWHLPACLPHMLRIFI